MADQKITELTENTTPLTTDLLAIVDDPGGSASTQKVTAGNVVSQLSSGADGWTDSKDTWVYVTASSFKIEGVDRTSTYVSGTKLKFAQTTNKYAVVTTSSFSTDTTVNIAVNTDYVIANATITSSYYSCQEKPRLYPTWFNYTPTIAVSGGTVPTYTAGYINWYSVHGDICTVHGAWSNATGGTAGAGTGAITLTVPIGASNTGTVGAVGVWGAGRSYENGGTIANFVVRCISLSGAGTVIFTQSGDTSIVGNDQSSDSRQIGFIYTYALP
jgi:hypothetical protein